MLPDATRGGRASATANDKLKRSWGRWLWGSMAVGAVVHAAAFAFTPRVNVALVSAEKGLPTQLLYISAFSDVDMPVPPAEVTIPIPALPTIDELKLDLNIEPTIPLPEFRDLSVLNQVLVPTLETERNEWLDFQNFAPFVVRPEIRNRSELKKFLERNYQPILEFSGATGVVQIFFWIDEAGLVQKAEIAKSSGSRSLDRLAMRLSKVLRFRPAMLAGQPIRVQVRVPITFRAA